MSVHAAAGRADFPALGQLTEHGILPPCCRGCPFNVAGAGIFPDEWCRLLGEERWWGEWSPRCDRRAWEDRARLELVALRAVALLAPASAQGQGRLAAEGDGIACLTLADRLEEAGHDGEARDLREAYVP